MIGMQLTFIRKVATGEHDGMGNALYTTEPVIVEDCLVAPISEPANAREQQALEQSRDQVRIHLPKAFAGNVSGSDVEYGGKTFHLDSDSVTFMELNTPTRWNRYFRAEAITS